MSNPTVVVTGKNTRFSYLNANEPKTPMGGGEPKYSVSLIIPKSDAVTVAKIRAAIQAAYVEGESKLRGNSRVTPDLDSLKTPLRDGDKERKGDAAYANAWFLNANSTIKPKAFDADGNEIIDSSELYSGIYGKAKINFYAYNANGNKGIAAGFQGLKKLRDGEHLGGFSVSAADFDDDDDDEEGFLD